MENLVKAQRQKGVEGLPGLVSNVKEGNEVRMLDALQLQIKAAGFKHHRSCRDLLGWISCATSDARGEGLSRFTWKTGLPFPYPTVGSRRKETTPWPWS